MSQAQNLFSAQSKTILVAATTTASTSVAMPAAGNTVRLVNEGPNNVYVAIGATAQTATLPAAGAGTATCTPVLVGGDITLSIAADSAQQISAITRTGTASLNIQVGEGS